MVRPDRLATGAFPQCCVRPRVRFTYAQRRIVPCELACGPGSVCASLLLSGGDQWPIARANGHGPDSHRGRRAPIGRRTHPRTSTPVARRGRKATGLLQSAGSPNGVASYVFLERIPLGRRPTGQPPSPLTFPPPAQPARLAGNDPDHPARAGPDQPAGAGRGELRLADRSRRGGRQRPARGDWPELPRP